MNIVILGAGLVGAPMAKDLAADRDTTVTVADISESAFTNLLLARASNLSRPIFPTGKRFSSGSWRRPTW